MFITGPDVIKTVTGEEVDFESLGGAMTHNTKSGVAHLAADDEDQLLEDMRYLLSFLPQNNLEMPPRVVPPTTTRSGWTRSSTPSSPTTRTSPTTCTTCIRAACVDDGEFFEIHEHYAKNIVCGFARLDGYAVGVVGNQPAHLAGVLDIDASREGRALRAHVRRLQHPDRHVHRRARASCPAPRRSGAASSATARSCSTPTPRRPCRRSPSSRARPTVAPTTSWPRSTCWRTSTSPGHTAEIAVMGAEGAVNIIYRRDIADVADAGRSGAQKLMADYKARFANPYAAAERGYIDDVIVPRETRPEADHGAGDAADQARARAEAQARQHPALVRASYCRNHACKTSNFLSRRPRLRVGSRQPTRRRASPMPPAKRAPAKKTTARKPAARTTSTAKKATTARKTAAKPAASRSTPPRRRLLPSPPRRRLPAPRRRSRARPSLPRRRPSRRRSPRRRRRRRRSRRRPARSRPPRSRRPRSRLPPSRPRASRRPPSRPRASRRRPRRRRPRSPPRASRRRGPAAARAPAGGRQGDGLQADRDAQGRQEGPGQAGRPPRHRRQEVAPAGPSLQPREAEL